MLFCTHCGYKLRDGEKFCHLCGYMETEDLSYVQSQRNTKNIEKFFHCCVCNAFMSERITPCPRCGENITGWIVISPSGNYEKDLRKININRIEAKVSKKPPQTLIAYDIEKLVLIRSFPLPVEIKEIEKFIILATNNIDKKLSMQPLEYDIYELLKSEDVNLAIQKAISDEWLIKMQLAYKNAERLFANDERFSELQKIYFAKLRELKLTKIFK